MKATAVVVSQCQHPVGAEKGDQVYLWSWSWTPFGEKHSPASMSTPLSRHCRSQRQDHQFTRFSSHLLLTRRSKYAAGVRTSEELWFILPCFFFLHREFASNMKEPKGLIRTGPWRYRQGACFTCRRRDRQLRCVSVRRPCELQLG
jgi:hypothetical protein